MKTKYIYIALAILFFVVTMITLNYLRKPHVEPLDERETKIKSSIDSSKYLMQQYNDSVKSLNDSVEFYRARIEENNVKLKKLQAKKNEAPKKVNVIDISVDEYKKFLSERYK